MHIGHIRERVKHTRGSGTGRNSTGIRRSWTSVGQLLVTIVYNGIGGQEKVMKANPSEPWWRNLAYVAVWHNIAVSYPLICMCTKDAAAEPRAVEKDDRNMWCAGRVASNHSDRTPSSHGMRRGQEDSLKTGKDQRSWYEIHTDR
jgi:hypothetical protein